MAEQTLSLSEQHPGSPSPRVRKFRNEEMDMTSMVDVTFLLVIFFMVTASFTVQSAFQTPQKTDSSAGNVQEENAPVEVHVDEFGYYSIVTEGTEVGTATNKYELLVELKANVKKDSTSAVILASPDAKHEKVVEALDVMVGLRLAVSLKLKS